MAKITLEVPDELTDQLAQIGDALRQATSCLRLPELLALSLQQPPLPARIYQYILAFVASLPTPEQILPSVPLRKCKQDYKPCWNAAKRELSLPQNNENSMNTSASSI